MLFAVLVLAFMPQAAEVPSHLKDAAALAAKGQFAQAKQALDALDPELAGVRHLLGVVHYNLREYAKASEVLKQAVESERAGTAAYKESALLIGQSEFLLAHYAEAAAWLEKSAAAAAEAHYMRGVSYIHLSQPDKAVEAFAAMFDVPEGSASAYLLTAQMMFRLEYLQQAEPLLAKAIAADPNVAGAHQLLGEIATFRNEIDRAVQEFTAELKVYPNSAAAYYKLGDAWSRREEWTRAIPALQKSIWLQPSNSGPYILLGKGYLKLEQYANAEGMLRRALQMDPNNASAHYLLGQTLMRSGREAEGREMLKRSTQLERPGHR